MIDDVLTSGVTLEEIGRVLSKEGNNQLYFTTLAVARHIKNDNSDLARSTYFPGN